jgi:hypothetical protein
VFIIRILINQSESQIQTYAMLSKYHILPITQEANKEDVAVIVDNNQIQDITQSLKLNIPIAVITNQGSDLHNQALKYIPAPAIVYYHDGKMQSDQKVFSTDEGLTVQLLEEICLYVKENKLYPSVYIWKPSPQLDHTPVAKLPQSSIQEAPQPQRKPVDKHTPAQTDFMSYISTVSKIIAVFKSTPDAQASLVAQEIAAKLGIVYLGVGQELQPSTINHAFSDGNTVNYNSSLMPDQAMVVEVDIQVAQAMEVIYNRAAKIVHVCGSNTDSGIESVKYWTQSGFKLDAVIPDQENLLQVYKSTIPLTVSVDEFVKGGV